MYNNYFLQDSAKFGNFLKYLKVFFFFFNEVGGLKIVLPVRRWIFRRVGREKEEKTKERIACRLMLWDLLAAI